jgi:hypothetical protein
MAWSIVDSKAYNDGTLPIENLYQSNVIEGGVYYYVELNIEVTQGKLCINGFSNNHCFDASGSYTFYDTAITTTLTLSPQSYLGHNFTGSIEVVSVYEIPMYQIIEKGTDIVVASQDGTGLSLTDGYVVQELDWSGLDGCYYLKIISQGIEYITNTLRITNNTDCTLLLSWTNNDNGFGFEFENTLFNPIWRGVAKLWKPNYEADKNEYYTDSKGTRIALYVRSVKKKLLTINEVPEYIHDALRLALKCDKLYIDGVQYVMEDGDYSPTWRNSSENAPVEVEVITYTQNTINSNCK